MLIRLSGITNFNTYSVVPSIIEDNLKKCAVPLNENGLACRGLAADRFFFGVKWH
jgi:hypothetical protein